MKKKLARTFALWRAMSAAVVAVSMVAGCMSMQGDGNTLDLVEESMGNFKPILEAYIEYSGPQARWAGPASFILHVDAKDGQYPKIQVNPNLFLPETGDPEITGRVPAAERLTTEQARDRLNILAVLMQEQEQVFRGCLSPVRVRLIRQDGSIIERQGCRGQVGWSKEASEVVNYFISGGVYGLARRTASN